MIDDPSERAPGGLVVLAEGDGWIVVAKPPRLLVHRNAFMPKADAALQRVRRQVGRRVYPIHRLDRNTSGCLLFATERERAGPLSAALSDPRSHKTYVALVRGRFAHEGPVVVDTPIKYDEETYKESRSVVRLLGRSVDPRCSLLEVQPETGRHHQVRRHVRDLHHPILHDGDHGDSRVNRWWRENRGLTRLALHCLRLHVHLDSGPIDVVSPLFEDHAAVFRALPFWEDAVAKRQELALPPLPMLAGAQ